jgi:hypothetical protein
MDQSPHLTPPHPTPLHLPADRGQGHHRQGRLWLPLQGPQRRPAAPGDLHHRAPGDLPGHHREGQGDEQRPEPAAVAEGGLRAHRRRARRAGRHPRRPHPDPHAGRLDPARGAAPQLQGRRGRHGAFWIGRADAARTLRSQWQPLVSTPLPPPDPLTPSPHPPTQSRIIKEDGVAGLFRGGGPTVVRAMALNMGMLASNDQAKEAIEAAGFEKGGRAAVIGGATIAGGSWALLPAVLVACLHAARRRPLTNAAHREPSRRPHPPAPPPNPPGFFASVCSLPFDFIKTRMQKMTPNPDGTMQYKSAVDCAMQTLRNEGPLKFYTGFPTFFFRWVLVFGGRLWRHTYWQGMSSNLNHFCPAPSSNKPPSPPPPPTPIAASRPTSSSPWCSWTRCPSSNPRSASRVRAPPELIVPHRLAACNQ